MTHTYKITGMTCGSCVARVKSELLKIGDVAEATVQLQGPQATITMQKHVSLDQLQQSISKAGNYKIDVYADNGNASAMPAEEKKSSYFPIILIFSFITTITFLVQVIKSSFSWMEWMTHFMAGFFFVFSFFKFLDLRGFANGYGRYDLVAGKIPAWGFIFPFIELGLGIAFLTGFAPLGTNIVTFIVMSVACIGVIRALLSKRTIQCACLGTSFNLPLSTVALFEDVLMVAMSLVMILMLI